MNLRRRIKALLAERDFLRLFIQELGWDRTPDDSLTIFADGDYSLLAIAEKRGFRVFLCEAPGAILPSAATRRVIERKLIPYSYEHIVIFTTAAAQMWMWASKEAGRPKVVRTFTVYRTQTGEALAQKLQAMAFNIVDEEALTLSEINRRARVFDVEAVTQRFYEDFKAEHSEFLKSVSGIRRGSDRDWYASIMLNRLMFLYFIQRKGFLDSDPGYLRNKYDLYVIQKGSKHSFFRGFVLKLCHEGLGSTARPPELIRLLGNVRYINGGLFEIHRLERIYPEIDIENAAFLRIFSFFEQWDWNLDVRPTAAGNEINPDILGHIFEKFVNLRTSQKQMGAYYTKEDVSQYIVLNTVVPAVLYSVLARAEKTTLLTGTMGKLIAEDPGRYLLNDHAGVEVPGKADVDIAEQVSRPAFNGVQLLVDAIEGANSLDVVLMLFDAVRSLRILDPTCGSGAFLFAALNVLFELYDACIERMEVAVAAEEAFTASQRAAVASILEDVRRHPRDYYVLRSGIVNNLYGVDIMEEAVEICKLRLFLKLVASVDDLSDLEPLPDIDFNIRAGNTLVGFATLVEVEEATRQQRKLSVSLDDQVRRLESLAQRCEMEFVAFQAEQVSGDMATEVKEHKARLSEDLSRLSGELNAFLYEGLDHRKSLDAWVRDAKPFHWYAEFYGVLASGGFDVIIGNPPFVDYSEVKTQYRINGYKTEQCGNLYAFVVERALALLQPKGQFGMIVPLSVTFSRNFSTLRQLLLSQVGTLHYSNFDNIPDRLFTGVKESENTSKANQQRITILILDRSGDPRAYGTMLMRWKARERDRLFRELKFVELTKVCSPSSFPKIGSDQLLEFWERWHNMPQTLGKFVNGRGKVGLVVPRTAGYYIAAYPKALDRTKQLTLTFEGAPERDLALVMINSNVFFWRWRVLGDAFDVTSSLIESCPVPILPEARIRTLAQSLRDALKECAVFKNYRGVAVPNVNYNKRMDILYQIDRLLIDAIAPDAGCGPSDFAWSKSNSCFEFDVPLSNLKDEAFGHPQPAEFSALSVPRSEPRIRAKTSAEDS